MEEGYIKSKSEKYSKTGEITQKRNFVYKATVEKVIYELLIKGWTQTRISEVLMRDHGFPDEPHCKNAVYRVISKFKENNDIDIDDLKAQYLEMYMKLYSDSVDVNKKTAKEILDSIVKLQGLITNKIEAKVDSTFEVKF